MSIGYIELKGDTAYKQIHRYIMKFCQNDKISTITRIFVAAEILLIAQDFKKSNCKETQFQRIILCQNSYSYLQGTYFS